MRHVLPILVLALLTGCTTTAFDAELRQSADTVAQRSGVAPDWKAPWADRASAWDGQSALSRERAVIIAISSNREIRRDAAMIGAARADFVQAGLLPNPVLSVAFGFSSSGLSMINGSVAQPIADLWLLPARVEAADAELREAVLRLSHNALTLVETVEHAHHQVYYQQSATTILRTNDSIYARQEDLAAAQRDAGLVSPLDVNRIQADRLANAAALRAAEAQLARDKRALLELMGRADAPAQWSAEARDDPPIAAVSEDKVIAAARAQRLDVLASQWTIAARVARWKEQRLGVLPDAELGAMYERDDKPMEKAMNQAGPMASLEIPIFDQNQARIAKARAELRAARAAADAVEQMAIREARQSFITWHETEAQAGDYRKRLVPLHEKNLALAQALYQVGEGDLMQLLDVQRGLNEARLMLAGYERDEAMARSELNRAVGGALVLPKATDVAATGEQAMR